MDVGPVLNRVGADPGRLKRSRVRARGDRRSRRLGKDDARPLDPRRPARRNDEFWDGTGFDLGRLRAEVFEPILQAEPAEYHAYSWQLRRPLAKVRVVLPRGVIVVEGVCALHRLFREAYDLRIWVEAPRELRLARGVARDGEESRTVWETRWMPGEDRYVERDDPISAADLIVDGS